MAKLIYVPQWLNDHLQAHNQPLDILLKPGFESAIGSKSDVINYHMAQYEFMRLLSCVIERGQKINLKDVFLHVDTMLPEVQVLQRSAPKDIDVSRLAYSGVGLDCIDFQYRMSDMGKVVYIIGVCSAAPVIAFDGDLRAVATPIMWSILKHSHDALRVENGMIDKSSVFRENADVFHCYVNALLAASAN